MSATTTFEPGTLHQVPPGTLVLERNIRDARPDPDLMASVKALGVLQPITAVVNGDGQLVVRLGHRRTLAALDAGRPTVPVYVAAVEDLDDAGEVDRLLAQYDENTHRADLTTADRLGFVEQLAAFGLSADQITRRARVKRDLVDTAMVVSASEVARDAAAACTDLTFDQAAAIAEFDDDPEVVEMLVTASTQEPASFEHIAQRARDERIRCAWADKLRADLAAAGVPVIDEPDNYGPTKVRRLFRLRDDKGKEITEAGHRNCGGHVGWLTTDWQWVDDDGNVVATSQGARQIVMPRVVYGCRDHTKYGHTDSWSGGGGSTKPKAADMTDAEREKAKKERRLVIENNKAWDAATVVRRRWLQLLAKFKTPPKGTAAFIAAALAQDSHLITDYRVTGATAEVFAAPAGTLKNHLSKQLQGASEARAQVVALAQVLAAYEAGLTRDSWRGNGKTSACGRYLAFIQLAGYDLADVEKFALTSRTV